MEIGTDEDEDDGKPYLFSDPDLPRCRSCNKEMELGSILCVHCGFHQKQKKKAKKTFAPLAHRWETTMPLKKRLGIFAGIQGTSLVLGIIGFATSGMGLLAFLGSWFVAGILLAFLLGTFEIIELTRDTRGRVHIIKTWRICFFAASPKTTPVRGFGGVQTSRNQEAGFWEWFILFTLLPGVIPALIWWFFTIHQPIFRVALTQDHGYPAFLVYCGRSEEQMEDIAITLSRATELRLER